MKNKIMKSIIGGGLFAIAFAMVGTMVMLPVTREMLFIIIATGYTLGSIIGPAL